MQSYFLPLALVVTCSCGRTGFETAGRIPGDGQPGINARACNSIVGYTAPVAVPTTPSDTVSEALVRDGTRMVGSSWSVLGQGHYGLRAYAFDDATSTFTVIDDYDAGAAYHWQATAMAVTRNAVFHSATNLAEPYGWILRRSVNRAPFETVVTSDDAALNIGIAAPSDDVILHVGNYISSTKGGWTVTRSLDGGGTWSEIDGPLTGRGASHIVSLRAGIVAVGNLDNGSAWTARISSDGQGGAWRDLGSWYASPNSAASASVAFELPDDDALFIGGHVSSNAVRIARLSEDGELVTALDFEPGRDASIGRATVVNTAGCTLVFANSEDGAHALATTDGTVWADYPLEGVLSVRGALRGAGDELVLLGAFTNGFTSYMRSTPIPE